jgi:hypothetical protein
MKDRRQFPTGISSRASQAARRAASGSSPGAVVERRRQESVVRASSRREREAASDVVQVRERCPGQRGGLGLERHELGVDPIAPVGLGHFTGEPFAQGGSVVA